VPTAFGELAIEEDISACHFDVHGLASDVLQSHRAVDGRNRQMPGETARFDSSHEVLDLERCLWRGADFEVNAGKPDGALFRHDDVVTIRMAFNCCVHRAPRTDGD